MDLHYRIVNVFTSGSDPFTGNPLAVVEDAGHLDDETMLALARQLNLSETTFITGVDADAGEAQVRIFTTAYEMPFAGHPTLGTASVVADLLGGLDAVTLRLPAGRVPVVRTSSDGPDRWTLTTAVTPTVRPPEASRAEQAAMLGLKEADLGDDALFVDAGVEQLVVPLAGVEAVHRISPVPHLLEQHARSQAGMVQVLVWAPVRTDEVEARFVLVEGGGFFEDPATGSACANLGGWLRARGSHEAHGLSLVVHQGSAVSRPSVLHLEVSTQGIVTVGGTVLDLGRGTFTLP
ncbi:MAG: PhzF family phenazine biosynthesis protein [Actinomycetota bacterium]|nr:PhzF family phenazine biosynthesis protein [Actinomycetota bacterium]